MFPKSIAQPAALIVWTLGLVCGLGYAWHYESTPTESSVAGDRWPAGSSCTRSPDRPTLVMFVHPHCPCSRASLEELAALMTHCRERLDAQVMFIRPASFDSDWTRTDLWDSAARIPGVMPRVDPDGVERRRFGASVSGETYVYSPGGELLFHGGITAGRGHVGENAGRSQLESYLLLKRRPARGTPVYGCELCAKRARTVCDRAFRRADSNPRDKDRSMNGSIDMRDIQADANALLKKHQQQIYRRTDRMFAVLMPLQWAAAVGGGPFGFHRGRGPASTAAVHPHVWPGSLVFGGVLCSLPSPTLAIVIARQGGHAAHDRHCASRFFVAIDPH